MLELKLNGETDELQAEQEHKLRAQREARVTREPIRNDQDLKRK